MNRNSIFQQNVKCSLANYRWLTCLIEIKLVIGSCYKFWFGFLSVGEKNNTQASSILFFFVQKSVCLFWLYWVLVVALRIFSLCCHMWDLVFLTRDWTQAPWHWEREVLAPGLPGKSPQLCSSWHGENPESLTLPSPPDIREVPGARESNINDHCHVRLPRAWHFYMLYASSFKYLAHSYQASKWPSLAFGPRSGCRQVLGSIQCTTLPESQRWEWLRLHFS